jgi:hypothetical protein
MCRGCVKAWTCWRSAPSISSDRRSHHRKRRRNARPRNSLLRLGFAELVLRYIAVVLAAIFTLLLAVQSAPAQQQNDRRTWYQAYADAQRAIQDRNWEKAIADLSVAAQRGAPKPGRNVLFYGDVYRDYNPDYYLGVAYTNLQRFADADAAFERVKQAQLINQRDPLYAEFTRQAAATKDLLQKQAAQARQAAPAQTAQNTADIPLPPNPPPTTANRPNVPAANPPASNPVIAGRNPAPAANAASNAVQGPRPTAPDPKVAIPPSRPNPVARPPTQRTANAAPTIAPLVDLGAAIRPLDERIGILQFFSGDYEAAAASLTAVAYSVGASPRSYFYLACSQAALVLTGKAPRSTLDAARAQLTRARDTGQFVADKRLISPRIKQELGMQP